MVSMWQSPNDFVLNNVFWNPKGFVSWTPPLGGWVKYNVEGFEVPIVVFRQDLVGGNLLGENF